MADTSDFEGNLLVEVEGGLVAATALELARISQEFS
jgi:hypothetical protein